jgi:iron complex outermembrane receptor protein
MFRRTKICAATLVALGGGLLISMPAGAQAQAQGSTVQRVEITGSSIRRVDAETASPVQVLSNADIEKSGKGSVAELLQTLAVDNQGSVPTTFGNGFASGASGISMRGLGAASTLVLINGRRAAPYGLADDGQKVFFDLNTIPLEAVDRVEVLKDGASAIYGSDAIAGVVNIILKREFQGTALKASYGQSKYHDGQETKLSFTHGFGSLDNDKYNVLFSLEFSDKNAIWNHDRAGRGAVGRADLRDLGFDANAALGGTGAITSGGAAAGSSILGNVRSPVDNHYYSRGNNAAPGLTRAQPNAICANLTSHQQGDPGGGCLIDASQQYTQVQPSSQSVNAFLRGNFQLSQDLLGYAEFMYYNSSSTSSTTPSGINGSVGYPGGPVNNAGVALGAAHPDNPFFGTAARVRYLAWDVGPRVSNINSDFSRFVAGVKGTVLDWDIDTAVLWSQSNVGNTRTGYLQRDVAFALLNPGDAAAVASATANSAAYRALPAGSVWRIGENAGLNSRALYAALSPTIANDAQSNTASIDFRASKEVAQLAGGGLGVAVGAEFRHESVFLEPTSGTDRGNIIGLGYSAYDGARNIAAAFAEVNAPVLKGLEVNGAVRIDHYTGGLGNSYTPKLGIKYSPVKQFALRGTFAMGFRAPSPAENGKGGLAAFSNAADPLRCNLGVAAACSASQVAIITSPNPDLKPEKSRNFTLGLVFEPMPGTNLSVDAWQIIRKNEINQETSSSAIAAGHVVRDPNGATSTPGDPGPILAVLTNYVNSNKTTVRGIDLDVRQQFNLGSAGKFTAGLNWTHLLKLQREEADGTKVDFAGTHGNCDVTNCIGTPKDRINLNLTYDIGAFRVATAINYRGKLDNVEHKGDSLVDDCEIFFADGSPAPAGCKIGSFTTVDLTGRWQATQNLQFFGGIRNLFDKIPPLDPTTYGAVSYNPLDYSGAVGRYYYVGAKYAF